MAEYSANAIQTVLPGQSIIFTDAPIPCERGFVKHRDDTGSFLLSGYVPNTCNCECGCNNKKSAMYLVDFGANIALAEGATVGPISVSFSLDGSNIASSTMIVTPAAVGDFFNISRAVNINVWRGCCESLTLINSGTQPIQVQNANIIFARPDLNVTR